MQSWLRGESEENETEESGGGRPRRLDGGLLVDDEIIGHFTDQEYLDPEDDRVLDEMLAHGITGGLRLGDIINRKQLLERLRARGDAAHAEVPPSIPEIGRAHV